MSALYVLGSWPSSWSQLSLVCQDAMLWTRPEGEGWRASKSPESRCSGVPLDVQTISIPALAEASGGACNGQVRETWLGGVRSGEAQA